MNLRVRLRTVAVFLCCASLVCGGSMVAFHSAEAEPSKVANGVPSKEVTASGVTAQAAVAMSPRGDCLRIGFSAPWNWIHLPAEELDRTMATAKSAGGVVRLGIEWNLVESNRGSYDWSASDRVVEAAARHGLDVIGLLYTTPEWARDPSGDPTSPLTPPRDEQQFARFASAAAERFGPSVRTWEVWNEPNIQDFWTTGADPAAYSRLLSATYTAVKAAQPGATVISGGLAPAETRPGHMAPNTFLSLMYTMGAKGYFDGYGIHPYSYPGVPVDDSQPWNPWSQMIDARRIMTTNGDGAKGVWITEFGAPTGTSPKAVSPELQAVIDSTGITAASRLPWIKSFLVYSVRDDGTDPAHGEDNFGVVARDWTPKPAYTAVGAAAREHGCSAESVAAVPQREDSANAGDRRE